MLLSINTCVANLYIANFYTSLIIKYLTPFETEFAIFFNILVS